MRSLPSLALLTLLAAAGPAVAIMGGDAPPPTAAGQDDYAAGVAAFEQQDWQRVIDHMARVIEERPWEDDAYNLTVQLPGVAKDGLDLTVEAGEFRLFGRRAWKQPEGWTALYRETANLPYELVLTHDNAIGPDHIAAELKDGVLVVSLPKAEALKPRKIAVT